MSEESRVEKREDVEIAHLYGCPACGGDHRSVTFAQTGEGGSHRWVGTCPRWGGAVTVTSIHTEEGLV